MNSTAKNQAGFSIIAPLSGELTPLDQVPDPVFSEKVLGDGIAILPKDGKIYSPVDGTLATIAATRHAYGFQTPDGLDILVHVGLETVGLNGEGFIVHKQEGDSVKAGELIAEADLELFKSKGLNPITPVLLCGGMEGKEMEVCSGSVQAGTDPVIRIFPEEQEAASVAEAPVEKEAPKKKKSLINFDFLQKLGKVLMTVIAVMPAAGLMLSVGNLDQLAIIWKADPDCRR